MTEVLVTALGVVVAVWLGASVVDAVRLRRLREPLSAAPPHDADRQAKPAPARVADADAPRNAAMRRSDSVVDAGVGD